MIYVGFFLVFAGMLIGYFLWYRDQSEEETLRVALRRENEDLRTSLKIAHNSHEKLDQRFNRQKGQLNVLQQLCDDWSTNREQAERDRAQLEVEIADKNRRFEEITSELQTEKQRRISLEDETHKLNQSQIEKLSELEDQWRKRHAKIESSLSQRQIDLSSTEGEKSRIAEQLHASKSKVAELQAELASQQSLLETATKNAGGLKQEYVSVESSLKESSELLKQSRSECAAALSNQNVAEEALETLQKNYEHAQEQIEELQAKISANDSLQSQVSSLQQSLKNSTGQLNKVTQQRDDTLKAEKVATTRASGLQNRIDNQETTIHRLRQMHDEVLGKLKVELETRSAIETTMEQKSSELENRLKDQTLELERRTGDLSTKFKQQHSELQNRISLQSTTIEQLTVQRDSLNTEVAETKNKLDQANAELESAKVQTQELTDKVEELRTTCQRISELEKLVQRSDQEDKAVVEELRVMRAQYAASYDQQQALQAELDRVRDQFGEFESTASQYDHRLNLLRTKLKASEETIRTLRRERAAVLARLANYRTVTEPDQTVISFSEAMERRAREATNYDSEYGGQFSQHAVRGLVYTEAPENIDDLKRISGIAEVLEARLNDYGIYTFKQIMEWKSEAIEEFSRLLAFKDRIERDEWLKQASYLYEQKQKRSVAA